GHAAELSVEHLPAPVEAEELGEPLLELALGDLPGLEASKAGHRLRVLTEQSLDGVLVEVLLPAEVGEAVPDRGGQHAAEVDEESGMAVRFPHRIWRHSGRSYRRSEASALA